MKCPPFEYFRPATLHDTIDALSGDSDARIIAGGQSLVPMLALRLARPSLLVDINRVQGLDDIRTRPGSVEVGALVRHHRLAAQSDHPLLTEAARWIGHTAIRTRGTLGGSIAHADPAAELPVVAVATDAVIAVAGPRGERLLPVSGFFVGHFTTSLDDDEVITSVRFRAPTRWGFAEFARRHGDFALVIAAAAEIDGVTRIALGGVGTTAQRATAGEHLRSQGASADEVADAAAAEIDPSSDLHASASYRRALTAEMVRRALRQLDSTKEA